VSTPDPTPGRIAFAIDRAIRLRTATFSGFVSDADLLGAYAGLVAEPDYDATLDDLVDLREVTHFGVSTDGLRQVIGMFAPIDGLGIPTRLAVVAPSDAVYGVSRMYQMLRGDEVPEEINVFRDLGEAHAWLAEGRAARGTPPRDSAA
jgi:hypothetical protein